MRDASNILAVAALRPDYMGFIFYEKSKRFVGNDLILPTGLSPTIKKVGVFVNEKTDFIFTQLSNFKLDYVQLHGDETPADCKALKEHNIALIKVFSVSDKFDFATAQPYQPYADFFMFDTGSPGYGGTGKLFDWNLLTKYDQQIPFFLSGGLSPENIQNVSTLKGMNLHAVDVNSGTEATPGIKDTEKIKRLQSILNSIS